MHDRQLYQQILGLSAPWSVQRVELCLEAGEVHVHLEHATEVTWTCAECGQACPLYDHQPVRTWRHLDTCQYQTLLHASLPRTQCADHGVRVVRAPWAEPLGRFTALFERLVLDWLGVASQQGVAEMLGLSWDEVHGILARAVTRGLARRQPEVVPYLGVDEKAYARGHRYVTIVTDLERKRVLHVAADRKKSSLDGFLTALTPKQRRGIEGVAMDMWEPYEQSVREHVPGAGQKIVYDKFHIAKHLNEAVDKVRKRENKELRAEGDDRLVGTKYDWLRNPANFNVHQWDRFRRLKRANLKTARAWALKEQIMPLWDYQMETPARKFFGWWYRWATHSRLKPVIETARMLKKRLSNIVTYVYHGITNAASESINAKIQWIKYQARGYRNLDNLIQAIYFHCGDLNTAGSPT